MFYRTGFAMVSPINTMLDRMEGGGGDGTEAPLPTIHDFLDEDDLLQECRSNNPRLVQYLCREEHLRLLIAFATTGRPPVPQQKQPKTPPRSADSGSPGKRERMPNGKTTSEELDFESSGKGGNTGTEGDGAKADDIGGAKELTEAQNKVGRKASEDKEAHKKTGALGREKSRFTVKEDLGLGREVSTPDEADEYIESGEYLESIRLVDMDAKLRFKYPYVCTEVLSAEVAPLIDAILKSDDLCDRLFSYIERCPMGALDPTLAAQFAKVIISFLKTRNTEIVNQMARRKLLFPSMLKHLYLTPITELIVRILDPPVIERPYQPLASPPSGGALGLLSSHKILAKLANCFTESLSYTSEIEQRRSEDTMSNAVLALHSITHRILRLPHLAVEIPPDLSPYERPEVVTALLDAGLEKLQENQKPFLLALNLASELLITESNVKQEYDVLDPPKVPQLNPAFLGRGRRPPLGAALGLAPNLPTGITGAPTMPQRRFSFHTSANPRWQGLSEEAEEESSNTVKRAPSPVDDLPVGSPLVSSVKLEEFLKKRFSALASMLGETTTVSGPLGSVRLKVAEFFVACFKVGCESTVAEISALDIPKKLLDLFLAYKWSSILHGVIAKSIITALEQTESVRGSYAARAWLRASVIPWLMKAWNEQSCTDPRFRAGYMGHLIQIGGALQTFLEKHLKISSAESTPEEDEAKNELKNELKNEEKDEVKDEVKDEEKDKAKDEAKDDTELSPLILGRLASEFQLEEKSVEEFYEFCSESLAPVRQVELTPLCDGDPRPGSDNEEYFEEPTEVFDMSDVIDGLTKGDPKAAIEKFSQYLLSRSRNDGVIEEEEAVVVDTDLSHFPDDDDDDDEPNIGSRDFLRSFKEDYEVREASRSAKSDDFGGSHFPRGWRENHSFSSSEKSGMKDSPDRARATMLEAIDENDAIATIDSSDEEDDEGTYEAFVAEKFEAQDLSKRFETSLKFYREKVEKDKRQVDVNEAVTEIEEPAPVTEEAEGSVAGVSRILDAVENDGEESSDEDDEDDEDWVEFSEVVDRSGLTLGTEETQGTT